MTSKEHMVFHQGGCHCGKVRFELKAPKFLNISECNCSICKKSGILHYVVRKEHFNLLKGDEVLTKYIFGTGIAEHPFCSICGIKSFYRPRAYPEGISVNANCIDTSNHWNEGGQTIRWTKLGRGNEGEKKWLGERND